LYLLEKQTERVRCYDDCRQLHSVLREGKVRRHHVLNYYVDL
jgi:hypothetical protein